MVRKLLSLVVALAVCAPLFAGRHHAEDPAFRQVDGIVQTLSEITGWKEEHPVPYGRMSKRQLRQFLAKRIKKTLRPEEIRADELALKMFGLVPQSFDLKKSTIDLLTEQAAAFYDYDQKRLFLLEDSSFDTEVTTLAHELGHALADQHFDLNKYMDQDPADDDENLARTAVVEGQASWLMLAYDLKHNGQPAEPTPEMLKAVADSTESSMAEYPVLQASPLYIQQSLLFPYAQGITFFDAVYKAEGKQAFSEVFEKPPSDTAQVMHPDLYLRHVEPTRPAVPDLPRDIESTEVSEGSVGEFDHMMLLWRYLDEQRGRSLAAHLRGGEFKIVRSGKAEPVLLYTSEWDSEDAARQYFDAYETVLRKKWTKFEPLKRRNGLIEGRGDSGCFLLRRDGREVRSMEGMTDEVANRVLLPLG